MAKKKKDWSTSEPSAPADKWEDPVPESAPAPAKVAPKVAAAPKAPSLGAKHPHSVPGKYRKFL